MPALNIFNWTSLTEAVNKITPPKTFVLDKLFAPRTKQHYTKTIQVDLKIGNRKMAPFVKRTSGAHVVSLMSKESHIIEAPSIRLKKGLTADELYTLRPEGESIYVGNGQTVKTATERKVAEELAELKDMVTRRMEWMACQALSGGYKVTQDDIEFEIDFNMPNDNKPALVAGALWSAPSTADPLADIRAWKLVVQNARGVVPTMAIARTEVITAMLNVSSVRTALDNRNFNSGAINLNNGLSEIGVTLIGVLEGVEIYEYNENFVSDLGVVSPMIPADRFIMVSPQSDNRLHFGSIDDFDVPQYIGLPFFSKSWEEKDPSVRWLLVASSPLPVTHEPETIVYAKVL